MVRTNKPRMTSDLVCNVAHMLTLLCGHTFTHTHTNQRRGREREKDILKQDGVYEPMLGSHSVWFSPSLDHCGLVVSKTANITGTHLA